jgi:hypothetical protein
MHIISSYRESHNIFFTEINIISSTRKTDNILFSLITIISIFQINNKSYSGDKHNVSFSLIYTVYHRLR